MNQKLNRRVKWEPKMAKAALAGAALSSDA